MYKLYVSLNGSRIVHISKTGKSVGNDVFTIYTDKLKGKAFKTAVLLAMKHQVGRVVTFQAKPVKLLNKSNFSHPVIIEAIKNIRFNLGTDKTGKIAILTNSKGKAWLGVQRVYGQDKPFKLMTPQGQDVTNVYYDALIESYKKAGFIK